MKTNDKPFLHTYISTPYGSLHQGKLQLPCTRHTIFYKLQIKHPHAHACFNFQLRAEKVADYLLYRHFCSEGHSGLSDVKIQLIDRANGEEQLREKEGQWVYRLKTLHPNGLNNNDFFFAQNRRSRRT